MAKWNSRVLFLLSAGAIASGANAGPIYSENFDALGFKGSHNQLCCDTYTSDKWADTDYFFINNFDNWTFGGGLQAQWATNGSDGAVSLNEGGGTASTTISGLTPGQTYSLSFDYWGDNEPGGHYTIDLSLNGILVLGRSGIDGAAGTNPGSTASVSFTPSGNSETLFFSQSGSTGGASPIFDNVLVTGPQPPNGVPEPLSISLFGAGLASVAALRRYLGRQTVLNRLSALTRFGATA